MGYILEFKQWKRLNGASYFNKEKGGKYSHLFNIALSIMDKLVTKYEYSPKLAAALCGNIFAESKFEPNLKATSGHYGLVQWGDSRLSSLKKLPNWQSIDGQLEFINIELNSKYFTVTKPIKQLVEAAPTVESAASIIAIKYEGAASSILRTAGAREIYDEYISQQDTQMEPPIATTSTETSVDTDVD